MEEDTQKLLDVYQKIRDNAVDRRNILINRLELFKKMKDNDFIPENPSKPFESDPEYAANEKDLAINGVQTTIDNLESEIMGRDEALYKMSAEGEAEYDMKLELATQVSELKSEIEELKQKLSKYENTEDGEEESN